MKGLMQAILPKELMAQEIKKRVEDMEDGEQGESMPYCMAADSDDRLWLDPGALVVINVTGSFTVKKTRGSYEVVVDPNVIDYRWERGEIDNNGELNRYTIPVSKITVKG